MKKLLTLTLLTTMLCASAQDYYKRGPNLGDAIVVTLSAVVNTVASIVVPTSNYQTVTPMPPMVYIPPRINNTQNVQQSVTYNQNVVVQRPVYQEQPCQQPVYVQPTYTPPVVVQPVQPQVIYTQPVYYNYPQYRYPVYNYRPVYRPRPRYYRW